MKIVVLDGFTLNPGDLSWDELDSFGEVTIYDRTPPDQIILRAAGCEIVLTNKTPLKGDTIRALPYLKYIGVLATGYNVVDIQTARENGIVVTNIPAYGTQSVAQMVFAHLLEICHHVWAHNEAVKKGGWTKSGDFCFWNYPLIELADKTLGIIGMGRIGREVAGIARAFGMKIIAMDPDPKAELVNEDFRFAGLDEVLEKSDVISLHCPLVEDTKGIINQETISGMKDGVILINTSRGQLIVEEDLAEALKSGKIAAAGLDVLQTEPPPDDHPLLKLPNCIITPHIAWAPREARIRLMQIAIENLRSFLDGNPVNVVS
ncbi:MAG: D-2-hydroxyacid dehydrogenase [Bacteroidota bacterium]